MSTYIYTNIKCRVFEDTGSILGYGLKFMKIKYKLTKQNAEFTIKEHITDVLKNVNLISEQHGIIKRFRNRLL